MKRLCIFLALLISLQSFAGAENEYKFSSENGCVLKKYSGKVWTSVDPSQVQGRSFKRTDSGKEGYSNFSVSGSIYATENRCLVAFSKDGDLPAPSADDLPTPRVALSRVISDLSYFTQAGTLEVNAMVSLGLFSGDARNGSVLPLSGSAIGVQGDFKYGVSDTFQVFISELYRTQTTTFTVSGNDVSSNRKGFSDPTVGFNWRFIENYGSGFKADFGLSGTPPIQKPNSSNLVNGSVGVGLSAAVYYRQGDFEAGLYPSYYQVLEGSLYDSFGRGSLGLSVRYHINSVIYIDPSVIYAFQYTESYRESTETTTTRTTSVVGSNFLPGIVFGYQLGESSLVEFAYGYSSISARSTAGTESSGVVTSTTTIDPLFIKTHALGLNWKGLF